MNRLTQQLLRPASIALIGASGDTGKHSSLPHTFLRRHGYTGRIYPINPHRAEIFGEPAFPSVLAINTRIDHAFIMLPTEQVEAALAECVSAQVACVTILSNGFAEAGEAGRARQARLVSLLKNSRTRLLGPNSIGLVNLTDGIALTANDALSMPKLSAGNLGLVSHSGSLMGSLLSRAQARGIGFSKAVSIGNETDLDMADIIDMLTEDLATAVITLVIETLRNSHRLAAALRRAHTARKPVVAYRLGRSQIGEQLAASHTGALAGAGAAIDSFLSAHGVLQISQFESLVEIGALVAGRTPVATQRAAVMTTSGGGGALIVDNLSLAGIEVVAPSAASVARLATAEVLITPDLLTDLTLAGTNPRTYGAVLEELLSAPDNDLVVAVVGSSAQFRPERTFGAIVAARRKYPAKPLAVFATPDAPATLALLQAEGIPGFRTPEVCADAIRAYFNWRTPRTMEINFDPKLLTRATAALRIGDAAHSLDAHQASAVFRALGLPLVEESLLPLDLNGVADEVLAALTYPLVLKIVSPDIAHKTEAGGVRTGITDAATLRAAASNMVSEVTRHCPAARLTHLAAQSTVSGLAEAIVGYRRDPVAGPMISVGVGGVLAEIYRDVATRCAPIDLDGARAMLNDVRGFAALRGYRGLPRGDLEALATVVHRLSMLATIDQLVVREAEINPVFIGKAGHGVVAVDALIVLEGRNAELVPPETFA